VKGNYTIPLTEGEMARDVFIADNGCESTTSPADVDPCVADDGCATPVQWCEHVSGHDWPEFTPEAVWQFFSAQ